MPSSDFDESSSDTFSLYLSWLEKWNRFKPLFKKPKLENKIEFFFEPRKQNWKCAGQ